MSSALSETVVYLDSSALAKNFATEVGSIWTTDLISGAAMVGVVRISHVEVAAALARKLRGQGMTHDAYVEALQRLGEEFGNDYLVVEIDDTVTQRAVELTRRHRLRAYDAIQLAGALELNRILSQAGLGAALFVAADVELLAGAEVEGLSVDNPNLHP